MARVPPHVTHRTAGGARVHEEASKDPTCVVAAPSHQTQEDTLGKIRACHLVSECSSTEIKGPLSRRTSDCLSTPASSRHLARILCSFQEVLLLAEVAGGTWSSSTLCQKMASSCQDRDSQGKDCHSWEGVEDQWMTEGVGQRQTAGRMAASHQWSLHLSQCCWGHRTSIAHRLTQQLLLRNLHPCIARKKVILCGWGTSFLFCFLMGSIWASGVCVCV